MGSDRRSTEQQKGEICYDILNLWPIKRIILLGWRSYDNKWVVIVHSELQIPIIIYISLLLMSGPKKKDIFSDW